MNLADIVTIGGIRIEFIIFGLTLLAIAIFHDHTLQVALAGLITILFIKATFMRFDIFHHLIEEWQILLNLFGLLTGFALLSKHFEESGVPKILPKYLPDDWKGPFVLLILIFIMSSFLDNIAAAMIGGTIANIVFRGKVHLGYLAGIVACSNAGGAGSVIGDTTTTMMWIAGIEASKVITAYVGSIPVLAVV
jgi:Na+/H+ antiporter NhaD/arsenite permease-like protein